MEFNGKQEITFEVSDNLTGEDTLIFKGSTHGWRMVAHTLLAATDEKITGNTGADDEVYCSIPGVVSKRLPGCQICN